MRDISRSAPPLSIEQRLGQRVVLSLLITPSSGEPQPFRGCRSITRSQGKVGMIERRTFQAAGPAVCFALAACDRAHDLVPRWPGACERRTGGTPRPAELLHRGLTGDGLRSQPETGDFPFNTHPTDVVLPPRLLVGREPARSVSGFAPWLKSLASSGDPRMLEGSR